MRLIRALLTAILLSCLSVDIAAARLADPAMRQLIEEVDALFTAERFDALDHLTERMRVSNAVFPGGVTQLSFVYRALAGWAPYDIYWWGVDFSTVTVPELEVETRRGRLERWMAGRPESQTARLSLVNLWHNHAWQARGEDWVKNVPADRRALFRERVEQASKLMSGVTFDEPEAYGALMRLARDQSWPRERMRALYDATIAKFPDYHNAHTRYAQLLEPRWFGRPGEREAFVESLLTTPGGTAGKIAYSMIAIDALWKRPQTGDLLKASGLRWPEVREGFLLREARQGLSSVDLNILLALATYPADRQTARYAVDRIGEAWEPTLWKGRALFDRNVAWSRWQPSSQ